MSDVLHQYKNGNVDVTIMKDGTKIREWPDNEKQVVEYPESCDLKITQYCDLDAVCVFCHEMSNKQGKHGDLNLIEKIWSNQLPGTELAIGGGNPLAHPDIDGFLTRMSSKGIIPNLTVNSLHMKRHREQLKNLQDTRAIYGLGISYRGPKYLDSLPEELDYKNVVFHMILGLDSEDDCKAVIEWARKRGVSPKILLLGYKQFGNGIKHYSEELQTKIDGWKTILKKLLRINGLTLSFDNLAINQLELWKFMSPEKWQLLFQGPDQTHTFYVDAIEQKVAGTSTSVLRYDITEQDDVRSIFNKVKIDWDES